MAAATASLALPSAPTFDPWAWIVFGRELVGPGIAFSTLGRTGWKPLPVLFTAPLGLLGDAAPSLWIVVARSAGLAAIVLVFRLAARVAGPVAGLIATLALVASSDWLRYLSAGNIEPAVAALLLGAVELHLRGRRAGAFGLGALAGLARPEVWPLVGGYAVYLLLRDRQWRPLVLGVPCVLALWVVPDWLGSGDALRTFHAATVSAEPHTLQLGRDPALQLVRGSAGILAAPVWIGASIGAVLAWRSREPTALALTGLVGAVVVPTMVGTALGYPAVPRYLFAPAALCCVLAGIGLVVFTRLPSVPVARLAVAAALMAASAPFAVSRAAGLTHQASVAEQRADDLASLWQAVGRARGRGALACLHPAIVPGTNSNALAWKLGLQLRGVTGALTPRTKVAFLERGEDAAIAQQLRRSAPITLLSVAGPWRVLAVRWNPAHGSAEPAPIRTPCPSGTTAPR